MADRHGGRDRLISEFVASQGCRVRQCFTPPPKKKTHATLIPAILLSLTSSNRIVVISYCNFRSGV